MAETSFQVFRGRRRGFQLGFKTGDERLVHHVIDDFARGVERAGLLASGRTGFRVIGGEKVFKHLTGQFGIERDFFFDGRVFRDSEFVVIERMNQPAHFDLLEFRVSVVLAQIHLALRPKEKKIRHSWLAVLAVGKAVNADVFRRFLSPIVCRGTRKAAVEKRDVFEKIEGGVGTLKQLAVPVENVRHEVALFFRPSPLVHFGVERGEEKVLQDGFEENRFAVTRLRWLKPFEDLGERHAHRKRLSGISPFSFTNQQNMRRVMRRMTEM